MVLEAKCYVYMISPLASNSTHVRLHAAEPRRMYDFRKYAPRIPFEESSGGRILNQFVDSLQATGQKITRGYQNDTNCCMPSDAPKTVKTFSTLCADLLKTEAEIPCDLRRKPLDTALKAS